MRAEERSRQLAVEEMRRKREEKWREHKRKEDEAEEMPNAVNIIRDKLWF